MIRLLQKIEDMLAAVAFAEAGELETSMGFMRMETHESTAEAACQAIGAL